MHVTPRTIKYWISGKVMVPYSAYKLVRVMRMFDLPMPGWEGWHMHSGKLWSPEGHAFTPADSEWWSGLIRRARLFHELANRDRQVEIALQRMRQEDGGTVTPPDTGVCAAPTGPVASPVPPTAKRAGGEAARPNLLLEHLTGKKIKNGVNPPSFAMKKIVKIKPMSVDTNNELSHESAK